MRKHILRSRQAIPAILGLRFPQFDPVCIRRRFRICGGNVVHREDSSPTRAVCSRRFVPDDDSGSFFVTILLLESNRES
jgi:hypothetical protein